MTALDRVLSHEEQVELMNSSAEDLIIYHHGFGRWIRNNWNLWGGGQLLDHMKSLGFTHPDDMSQSIILEYWSRKNNRPSTIAESVVKYVEYWEKNA